jgi:xanthine dehydrogenase YagR molybdenum-binding subunit
MTTRIVKTTSEFEGTSSDVFVLVDSEDEQLGTWDEGSELAVVGRPTPRVEGPLKVSGRARYTVDVSLPAMLHTAVLRSPVASGRVTRLDVEAARGAPGVRAVLGPDDQVGNGSAPLLSAEPEFVGEPIAAVAADSAEQAQAALAAFELELEPTAFSVDLADSLYAQRFVSDPVEESRGNAEAALAAADARVELDVETPAQLQTAFEPHAAVADWTPDGLTLWLSTQSMFWARGEVAGVFGIPQEQIRVIAEHVGGGFGAKLGAGFEPLVAAELSRRTGRPVRVVNDRREEQLTAGHRAWQRHTVRLGARSDGTLTAIEHETVAAMGVGPRPLPFRMVPMTLYRCENVTATTFPVRLNLRSVNAFRAPGVVEATTAFEQAMDELAASLSIDPLELRRRNHADVDQRSGKPYSRKALLACYDRAAELSGWAERDRLRDDRGDGLQRGLGCGSQIWGGGGGPPAQATVRLAGDGAATVLTGIQDPGTGTLTSVRVIAAEALGIPLERISVHGGDTGPNLVGPAAGGSQTTGSALPAVRAAAVKVRRKLLDLASELYEITQDDLVVLDGRIRSRDRTLDRPYTEVLERLGTATLEAAGARLPNATDVAVPTFGCQIAQVAVDPGLGTVVVEKVWAVHDVGRIVNPLGATSQVEGGILQSVGYALSEERVLDPTLGAPTNSTLDDYKLPTIADAPEIVVEFVEVADVAANAIGSKGLGEPPAIPTAAAIANAFAHATGRRSPALPLTPQRVLETLA